MSSSRAMTENRGEAAVTPPTARKRARLIILAAFAGVVALPWIANVPDSLLGSANIGASHALVAVSLVLLTGWVGQISLGHAAFVGIGAYVTGHAAAADIAFPLNLPIAAAAAGIAAALLGIVALRVRGLYLAVVTLIFSWMASEFLFRQLWFTSNSQISRTPIGEPGSIPSFDLTDRRIFFVIAWAIVAVGVYVAANLRDSKTGRAFFAVRGSEVAAASLGIDVMRYKLLAFGVSGAIAGVAGNVLMTDALVVTADQFTFTRSLFYLAVAVVGGLSSLGGAIASALVFAGLNEVFFRVRFLGGYFEFLSAILLAVTLLAYRGGLAGVASALRPRLAGAARILDTMRRRTIGRYRSPARGATARVLARARSIARRPAGPTQTSRLAAGVAASAAPNKTRGPVARGIRLVRRTTLRLGQYRRPHVPPPAWLKGNGSRERTSTVQLGLRPQVVQERQVADVASRTGPRPDVLQVRDVTVRFGGLVAVSEASLTVRQGEIVGLIGPNGAGKTTLFNAIAGFNTPTDGHISLDGKDITTFPVHQRARLGVARTFQQIQMFGELSVFENLLVATHVENRTGVIDHVLVTRRALEAESACRDRVREVLHFLDLDEIADRRAADLPFGILRMVELARALVTRFPLVMLDEPASGLDNAETDRFAKTLRSVRDLGLTLLVIEHDVHMVTSVCDRMYVIDRGQVIATGTPQEIQRNPEVIAAYLGEPEKEAVG